MRVREMITILFCLLLVFGLVGCKKKTSLIEMQEDKTSEITEEDQKYFADLLESKGVLSRFPDYTLQYLVLNYGSAFHLQYLITINDDEISYVLYFTRDKISRTIVLQFKGLVNPSDTVISNFVWLSQQFFGLNDLDAVSLSQCILSTEGRNIGTCADIAANYNFLKIYRELASQIAVVSKSVADSEEPYHVRSKN